MGWKNAVLSQGGQEIKHAAAYMLLGQTEWILRRSETVTFTSEGSTRRHITFDCMLPDDSRKWLKWIPDDEEKRRRPRSGKKYGKRSVSASEQEYQPKYVGLPVTFLGKGDLINLDVRDGEGNVLHTAGRGDDAAVLIHALENCLYELGSRDFLLYELNVLALQEIRELLEHAGGNGSGEGAEDGFCKDLAYLGCCIVAWCRVYCADNRNDNKVFPTDEDLFTYFDGLRSSDNEPRYHSKSTAQINSSVKYAVLNLAHNMVVNSSWSGILHQNEQGHDLALFRSLSYSVRYAMGRRRSADALNAEEEGVPANTQRIDYARKKILAAILAEQVEVGGSGIESAGIRAEQWRRQRDDSKCWLEERERLGCHEYDWCVRALMRFLFIWQHGMIDRAEYLAMQAYLLLLSSACDTYPLVVLVPIERVRNHERLMVKIGFDAGYRESLLQKLDLRNQTIDLAFQTYSARSTHIEVAAAEGIVLTNASEIISSSGLKEPHARKRFDRSEATSKPMEAMAGILPHRVSPVSAKHHLSARIAAGRLHMSTSRREKWPLTHLRLTLMLRRNFIASFVMWSLLTLMLNVGIGCVIGIGPWPGLVTAKQISPQVLSFFSAQNVVGAIAVVFTLWVARRISTMQHRVVEGLNSSMTAMMNINLLLFTCLFLVACGGMIGNGDDITGGGWQPVWRWITLACLLVSAAITAISISEWIEYLRRNVKMDGTFRLKTYVDSNLDHATEQDAIMPADRSAFSALEFCDSTRRREAVIALRDFLRAFDRNSEPSEAPAGHPTGNRG